MAGSPKKRAKREAAERARQSSAAVPESSAALPAGPSSESRMTPAGAPSVPVPKQEVLPPLPADTEPTRTALKRAMRQRAQEYAEKAIAVLARNLDSKNDEIAARAANDMLAWGFGKPGLELETGDGGLLVTIQKFGASHD